MIVQQYPGMTDKDKWTIIGCRIITADEVGLTTKELKDWKISMDRSMVCWLDN